MEKKKYVFLWMRPPVEVLRREGSLRKGRRKKTRKKNSEMEKHIS